MSRKQRKDETYAQMRYRMIKEGTWKNAKKHQDKNHSRVAKEVQETQIADSYIDELETLVAELKSLQTREQEILEKINELVNE